MSHTNAGAVEFTMDSQLRRCFVLNGGPPVPCTAVRYTGQRTILAGAGRVDLNVDARTCWMWAHSRVPRRAAL